MTVTGSEGTWRFLQVKIEHSSDYLRRSKVELGRFPTVREPGYPFDVVYRVPLDRGFKPGAIQLSNSKPLRIRHP